VTNLSTILTVTQDASMLSDDELVERGKAIFRTIVARKSVGVCTRRIARDRYCPRPAAPGSMTCEQHPLIVPDGWDDPDDDSEDD